MNSSVKKYGFLPRRQLCKIPNFISTYKIVSKHLSHDGHTPAYLWIISWFPYTELLFKCLLAIKKHVPHTNQNLQISVLSFPNCLRGNMCYLAYPEKQSASTTNVKVDSTVQKSLLSPLIMVLKGYLSLYFFKVLLLIVLLALFPYFCTVMEFMEHLWNSYGI